MAAKTAKGITGDIRWIMEDNRLDRDPGFKVQTSRKGDSFVTNIVNVDATKAKEALALYASNTPGVLMAPNGHNGWLVVTQPAVR